MASDQETRLRIIKHAEEMFRHYSFAKVTMEEIASELGISKKTLYKHFSNKEHLLKEVVINNKCEVDEYIDSLMSDNSLMFIEKLIKFMNFIAQITKKLDGSGIQDLMRKHPDVWRDLEEFRANHAHKNLSRLIMEGVKDGIFRNDVNTDVVVLAYVAAIHSLITPETLAKLPVSADQAFRDILKILFEGIFTDEGRNKYKSAILENENIGV